MDEGFWQTLPHEIDVVTYRSLHPSLAHLSDSELLNHYIKHGREEGRRANHLRNRNDFIALVPQGAKVLEIGPFCKPLVRGSNVSYFDVLSQEGLVARAKAIGRDPEGTPPIDYVSPNGDLSVVSDSFDAVLSSHCIEHQPDLIKHLQDASRILTPGGAYFLLIPDKRYCFDHFIPPSNIAEILVAHHERRTVHTLRSVIEHRALTTHNNSLRHWQGEHGSIFDNVERWQAAIREFDRSAGKYIDVHAWYFTPESARSILAALRQMGLIHFEVQRIYPTRHGANEFWAILKA